MPKLPIPTKELRVKVQRLCESRQEDTREVCRLLGQYFAEQAIFSVKYEELERFIEDLMKNIEEDTE